MKFKAAKLFLLTGVFGPFFIQGLSAKDAPEKETYTKEEVKMIRELLKKEACEGVRELEVERKRLEALKTQISKRLSEIKQARKEIAEYMNMYEEKEETKLKKLASFYETMELDQATMLLQSLSDSLIVKIFDRMSEEKAGALLSELSPKRAADITAEFSRLKRKKAVNN